MLHSLTGVSYPLRPRGACPAGFVVGADVVVAGAGAPLEGDDAAEDNWLAPVELEEAVVLGGWEVDVRATFCCRAVVPRIAAEGGSAGGSISVAVLGEGSVMVLGVGGVIVGEDAGVVTDGRRSSVSVRRCVLAPGQFGNAPAKTKTANAAAATTAVPITSAAAT